VRLIQIANQIERRSPRRVVDSIGVRHEQDGVAFRSELDALMHGRQKPAAPARLSAVGRVFTREQHDEARQVAALAPQPVREPGTEARTADHLAAGVHEDLSGRVIELRRMQRPDDRDVVGGLRGVRQQLRDFGAAGAVTREAVRRPEELRRPLDERESLAFREELVGNRAAVVLLQRRLVIEEIDLRRRASHEQIDDPFRAGRKVGAGLIEQRPKRGITDAEAGLLEEMTPCDLLQHRHSFVIVSSRFSSALATSVHAACSGASTPVAAYRAIA
jgi:hypothetical protein